MTACVPPPQGVEPAAKRPRLVPLLCSALPNRRQAPSDEAMTAGAPAAEAKARTAQMADLRFTVNAGRGLPERICHAALQHWERMAKTGKPQPHEHTCMAAFAVESPPPGQPQSVVAAGAAGPDAPALSSEPGMLTVVALGTGMKCLSADARCAAGRLINDSHAEVIAKRALQRWIYEQLSALIAAHAAGSAHDSQSASAPTDGSQPEVENDFFVEVPSNGAAGFRPRFRPGCRLYMWVSQAPCGDASIVQGDGAAPTAACDGVAASEATTRSAARRTGAKPLGMPASVGAAAAVPGAADVESEAAPQRLEVVRRKPGRGAATLSLSCSDKLARWSLLGVQVRVCRALVALAA